jgi:hypothetical protein
VPPEFAAAATSAAVREIDRGWSTCPKTLRRARLLELSGWAYYVAGRGGVLGDDARADTVSAALGLVAPDAVRAGWDAARKVGPAAVAAARLAECARWGDERLTEVPQVETLVGLAERLVVAADPVGMPLFAACRAMPVPGGGVGGRAALLIHLMYEYRCAAMLLAARACGLSPVETIIGGPEGEEEAVTFGWHPPFPTRITLYRRYAYAEAIADRIVGQAYATLSSDERRELSALLDDAAGTTRPDEGRG